MLAPLASSIRSSEPAGDGWRVCWRRGEEACGLQVARVRRIQNGDAVVNMPNVNVLFVTITCTLSASAMSRREMCLMALPDSLRGNLGIGRDGRRQPDIAAVQSTTELFQVLTGAKFRHGRFTPRKPICRPSCSLAAVGIATLEVGRR